MDRTKIVLYADAVTVVLCLAGFVIAATSHLAYRAKVSDLAIAAPSEPAAATEQVVPFQLGSTAPFFITQAQSDKLATLNTVTFAALALSTVLAAVILSRGTIPRLSASFGPWRRS